MQYGHFDNKSREYVIDRVDLPVSWTNYIGVGDMYGVFNHTAGGYLLYKTPEYHRITRFRPNGVPMDGPGHYIYIRDDETGDYWSVSWQPVGRDMAKYSCRHGLSYVKYLCDYSDIHAEQTLFVAMDDPVELWNLTLCNDSGRPRRLSVYSYCEFSFHQIDMDNRNFQMSLYAAGSSYADGIIEHERHYEENGFQFFAADFEPDGFDCLRDDPCVPADWKEFSVTRKWRGGVYNIHVVNPDGAEQGVREIIADGRKVDALPVIPAGNICNAEITMG